MKSPLAAGKPTPVPSASSPVGAVCPSVTSQPASGSRVRKDFSPQLLLPRRGVHDVYTSPKRFHDSYSSPPPKMEENPWKRGQWDKSKMTTPKPTSLPSATSATSPVGAVCLSIQSYPASGSKVRKDFSPQLLMPRRDVNDVYTPPKRFDDSCFSLPKPEETRWRRRTLPTPAEIGAILRETPKGKLRYDRGGGGGVSRSGNSGADNKDVERDGSLLVTGAEASLASADETTPTPGESISLSPSSPCINSSFQSVLEEVSEEINASKLACVAEVALRLNEFRLRSPNQKESVPLGSNAVPLAERSPSSTRDEVSDKIIVDKTEDAVQDPKSPRKSPLQSPSRESETIQWSPKSFVEKELERMEEELQRDLWKKKLERHRKVREHLEMLQVNAKKEYLAGKAERLRSEEERKSRMAEEEREAAKLFQLERKQLQELKAAHKAFLEKEASQKQAEKAEQQRRIRQQQQKDQAAKEQQKLEEEKRAKEQERDKILLVLKESLYIASQAVSTLSVHGGGDKGGELNAIIKQGEAKLMASDIAGVDGLLSLLEKKTAEAVEESLQQQTLRQQQQEVEEAKKLQELAQKQQGLASLEQSSPDIRSAAEKRFRQLVEPKLRWQERFQPLQDSDDKNLKAFLFSCRRAVNTPVNAISAVSSAHLKDKLEKLRSLLSGTAPELTVLDKPLASPDDVNFCKGVLAKKLVAQGAEVVSSKPEFAFSMATVAATLWAEFPDFGSLFLAYLMEACPYLAPPCPVQKNKGSINEAAKTDHYRSLGYLVAEDGQVEKQEKFVKRMSGLARLYAAVCVARLGKSQSNNPHPHGVGHLWTWLAATANDPLGPVNDVTATLIYDVLEVAGNQLAEDYGKIFVKQLVMIYKDFFPKIKEATLEGSGGPVSRLEIFLQKALAAGGMIAKPSKQLRPDFI